MLNKQSTEYEQYGYTITYYFRKSNRSGEYNQPLLFKVCRYVVYLHYYSTIMVVEVQDLTNVIKYVNIGVAR